MEYSSIQNNILSGVPKNGSVFNQQYNKRLSEILHAFAEGFPNLGPVRMNPGPGASVTSRSHDDLLSRGKFIVI